MRSKKESRASMIVTYSSPSSRGESLRCEKFNFASTEVCASKNFYFGSSKRSSHRMCSMKKVFLKVL